MIQKQEIQKKHQIINKELMAELDYLEHVEEKIAMIKDKIKLDHAQNTLKNH